MKIRQCAREGCQNKVSRRRGNNTKYCSPECSAAVKSAANATRKRVRYWSDNLFRQRCVAESLIYRKANRQRLNAKEQIRRKTNPSAVAYAREFSKINYARHRIKYIAATARWNRDNREYAKLRRRIRIIEKRGHRP